MSNLFRGLDAISPAEPKPEHVEALKRISDADAAEVLLLDRLVGELLDAHGGFALAQLVDLWGTEAADGWTTRFGYDEWMTHRKYCFSRARRYVDGAVSRGELAKETVVVDGHQRCFYARKG